MLENIEYNCLPGYLAAANNALLSECSRLYSEHYGIWSENGIRPKQHIKLSENKIREWLENDNVTIYYATENCNIIGYAIAFSRNEHNYGIVTWVTQLVVHEKYRHNGIAKNLLFSIWGFSNHYAWGIVSANPYAIRALEKATRRRAIPIRIKKNATKLRNIGRENVPFITDETIFKITDDASAVNTNFFVDHSNTPKMLLNVTTDTNPWNLGDIDEGWEWFAFTFNDQKQISLSQDEIENMVATSDSVVRKAYSKMNLDEKNQTWMKHTVSEVDYIFEKISLMPSSLIYDLGCGTGRHSIEFSKRNMKVIGIDYISDNIKIAQEKAQESSLENIQFIEADCRTYNSLLKAPVVICLYDVVGSFANNNDNKNIIMTAYQLLEKDGYAFFSVMNYESTAFNAKNFFSFDTNANQLLELPASDTMEKSGNVFNPDYYIVDTNTHLIYRKEQFSMGAGLPVELIVRDRRFTMKEIISLCKSVGFTIIEAKYINANDWRKKYVSTDKKAKEILLICKK